MTPEAAVLEDTVDAGDGALLSGHLLARLVLSQNQKMRGEGRKREPRDHEPVLRALGSGPDLPGPQVPVLEPAGPPNPDLDLDRLVTAGVCEEVEAGAVELAAVELSRERTTTLRCGPRFGPAKKKSASLTRRPSQAAGSPTTPHCCSRCPPRQRHPPSVPPSSQLARSGTWRSLPSPASSRARSQR